MPESDALTITAVGSAVNGEVTLSEDKATVTYTHDGSETTSGSFTYTVSDGSAADTATVNVTVTPVNAAPVAVDDTATVGRGRYRRHHNLNACSPTIPMPRTTPSASPL